jgi:hypothetical protein
MLWKYQLRRFTAVLVATVLCAGVPVQRAVAQTLAAKCDTTKIDPNNPTSCKQTLSITKPAGSPCVPGTKENCNANRVTVVPETTNQQVSVSTNNATGNTTWQGLNWGIGIAADFDLGGKRVTGAEIDNVPGGSIVRVTDTSGNVGVSFVLEAHYFFVEWPPYLGCLGLNCSDVATGPFVAIEVGGGATATPSSNGPITVYALGWMVGLHHPWAAAADSKLSNSSWNFGVGLRVDPSAKIFGDGVRANQPPPPGITTADQLFKKEPRYGIMLLSSFSF